MNNFKALISHKTVLQSIVVAIVVTLLLPAQTLLAAPATQTPTIIGGEETSVSEYPWMLALVDATEPDTLAAQFCGASLIDPMWVLTAAHCVVRRDPNQIEVLVGRTNLTSVEGVRLPVAEVIFHTQHLALSPDYDIALLRLPFALDLPTLNLVDTLEQIAPETMATVIGWGATRETQSPETLLQVNVPLVSEAVCNGAYSHNGKITDTMLCAGFEEGGFDSCSGDSGGPLVIRDDEGNWRQAGIVSWGFGCAMAYKYGVYSNVLELSSWIAVCQAESSAEECSSRRSDIGQGEAALELEPAVQQPFRSFIPLIVLGS